MRDPWREGKYLDLWSLVHLHAGFLLAWLLIELDFVFPATVAGTLLLLAAYEVAEVLAGVEEHASNRITDVVVGMAGLALAQQASGAGLDAVVPPVVASFALLNLGGWLAWRRRERSG